MNRKSPEDKSRRASGVATRRSVPSLHGRLAGRSPISVVRSALASLSVGRRRRPIPAVTDKGLYRVAPPDGAAISTRKKGAIASRRSRQGWILRVAGALLVVALGMAWAGRESDRVSATVIVPASLQQEFGSSLEPVGADAEADPRLSRPVFPMSVIPGGAYSIDELRAYLEKDEVARKSFEEQAERMGDPDLLDHLVVAKVTKPIKMHTQLRQNNKLFWSSDPVTVEPGETGFFSKDTGDLAARGRCGNVMLVTVPEGGVRVPAPRQHQIQSSGGTPPPQQTPPMVLPSSGVRQPQMSMPYQVPAAAAPIVLSMPAAAPPPTVPMMAPAAAPAAAAASSPPPATPYYPPPQIQKSVPWEALLKTGGGDSFPWWAALGGLGGALDLGGKGDVSIVNNNQQQQKQQQEQEIDVDIEVIPEPATMLLMAFGLGATGFAARRKRRK